MSRPCLRWRGIGLAAVLWGLSAMPGEAQVLDTSRTALDSLRTAPTTPALQQEDTIAGLSPRDALIRSIVLPGWGQAAFDSYFRGGVYFAGWAGNWFMIFRTQVRLNEARARFDQRVGWIEADLIAASPNPDSMRAVLDTVPAILDQAIAADQGPGNTAENLGGLIDAREQQREDWIAWSLFWLLASGVDAFVTAHLADFPAAIELEPGQDRSMSLRLEIPLHRRRP